jgi:hypothetical protein
MQNHPRLCGLGYFSECELLYLVLVLTMKVQVIVVFLVLKNTKSLTAFMVSNEAASSSLNGFGFCKKSKTNTQFI